MADLAQGKTERQHSPSTASVNEDPEKLKHEGVTIHDAELEDVAQRGHVATDEYGHALVTFDPKEEARVRLKIDLYIVPTVFMLYLFCFIDRANIGNANIAGFQTDLGLVGYDYNIVLSAFYVSYIVFEIPSNLACKYFGPGRWIPFITLGFGILSVVTAFVQDRAQAAAVRFLLGIFEAGMLPGIAYYLSRWYRKSELIVRLALYVAAAPLAGAFGGLLASGILKLDGIGSLKSWRQLFLVEGVITCGLAVIGYFTMTDRPQTARWLNEHEKALAIARVKSENVGTTEVLDGLDKTKILRGIFNPATLGIGSMFLLDNITVQGLAFFLPKIIATIYPKNSVIFQQVRTVPPYLVGGFVQTTLPFISWRIDKRYPLAIFGSVFMMTGYAMFLGSNDPSIRYGATFIIASGAFVFGSLCNAWVSANSLTDTARAAAIGTNVMMGNIGGLISTWSFLPFDAPSYRIGNGLNLGTSTTILVICITLIFWMRADNKRRQTRDVKQELSGLSQKEIQDLDWKHPSFRWRE